MGEMESKSSVAVPVVGMHRSGTSMVSRMLEAGGVFFGPSEELAGPNSDNPKGFWEHHGLRDVNEDLLKHFGGTWRNPPRVAAHQFSDSAFDDLKKRAHNILGTLEKSSECWGWKDPRSSVLFPFWRSLLPENPRPILCLRHPSDVAASLARRNQISSSLAGFLWQEYSASACLALKGLDVLVLSYEKVLQDPVREANRCARFLAEAGVELDFAAMAAAVDPALAHHEAADQGFLGWCEGGEATYSHLLDCASDNAKLSSANVRFPAPPQCFYDLMAESSDLAHALDFRENAYQDRIHEARLAMKEKDAATANCASAVRKAAQMESTMEDFSIKLEECRANMDNLKRRSEVRLGESIRNLFRS